MNVKLLRLGGRRVLVTKPNLQQYGHLGLEILMSLTCAQQLDAEVYFVRPRPSICDALFELEADDVRILRPNGALRRLLDLRWNLSGLWRWFDEWRDELLRIARQQTCLELERRTRDKTLPRDFRLRLRDFQLGLVKRERAQRDELDRQQVLTLYYRRRWIRERVLVSLKPEAEAEAVAQAERLGIAREAPIVTLHVREPGYKLGREIQERKLGARDDSARNSRIESYFKAVDCLLGLGYTVVRIGDPTMTPVRREGVIDLATSSRRSQLVELYCLLRSTFLVCGEAGPAAVSYLTNTPCLTVNATDPISSYPIRSDGVYILKGVVERETDRRLSLDEMLGREYLENLRNTTRYRYVDNSPDEVLEAVQEMVNGVTGGWKDAAIQAEFRLRAARVAEELRSVLTYVRKWGADQGFLGDGRLGRAFAERYLFNGAVA